MLTPSVQQAIEEIETAFSDCPLTVREDGEGGALVTVENVPLGHPFQQEATWVGFHITFPYPNSDVYPHFVRGDLRRLDGKPLGDAMSPNGTFERRPGVQISRKSNRLDPVTDTALHKMLKILGWLRSRP
jgi:hypothetical protein